MIDKPITVSCVSYLNSQPFIFGLNHHPVKEKINLNLDTPAECARKLISGNCDVGLVPVVALPLIKNVQMFPSYCIGSLGPVKSVLLLSHVPIKEISKVLLDYQSNTSVQLVKLLAKKYWKIKPEWLNAKEGFEELISDKIAGVVIGDRALNLSERFEFNYDLSDEWFKFTGLPFVFACWVSNKKLSDNFVAEFESALKFGLDNIDEVISFLKVKDDFISGSELYLKNNISYHFDARKKEAMNLFLRYCTEADGISIGNDASVV